MGLEGNQEWILNHKVEAWLHIKKSLSTSANVFGKLEATGFFDRAGKSWGKLVENKSTHNTFKYAYYVCINLPTTDVGCASKAKETLEYRRRAPQLTNSRSSHVADKGQGCGKGLLGGPEQVLHGFRRWSTRVMISPQGQRKVTMSLWCPNWAP